MRNNMVAIILLGILWLGCSEAFASELLLSGEYSEGECIQSSMASSLGLQVGPRLYLAGTVTGDNCRRGCGIEFESCERSCPGRRADGMIESSQSAQYFACQKRCHEAKNGCWKRCEQYGNLYIPFIEKAGLVSLRPKVPTLVIETE